MKEVFLVGGVGTVRMNFAALVPVSFDFTSRGDMELVSKIDGGTVLEGLHLDERKRSVMTGVGSHGRERELRAEVCEKLGGQ